MRIPNESSDPLLLPMEVVDIDGQVMTIHVGGEIDLDEAGELRAVLADASSGSHHTIIVDLTDVHFVGSSGLGVLAELGARLDDEGRTVMIRGCRTSIRRALEVTGLGEHLHVG